MDQLISLQQYMQLHWAVERGLELFLDEIGNHQKLKVLVLHTDYPFYLLKIYSLFFKYSITLLYYMK